jgi:hypothetical protein
LRISRIRTGTIIEPDDKAVSDYQAQADKPFELKLKELVIPTVAG